MIPASQKFKDALPYSHIALSRAKLLVPTSQNTYVEDGEFAVSAGSLNIDGRRNIRRQGNVTLSPASGFDLTDFNKVSNRSRLRIERGLRFIDGSEEWVPIATLAVQSATRSLREGTLKVSAYDPSSVIDDFTLITPYAPFDKDQKPLTTVQAIQDLVDIALWETAVWHIGSSIDTAVKPQAGTVFTGSRWDAINKLAKSVSAEVFVDNLGEWHLQRIQTGDWVAVETLTTGESGVLVDGTTAQNRRDLFNAVPLRWEGPTGGGLVFVVDDDPQSPTFWNGPFGRRPSSEQKVETVTTQEQAISAAKALLAQFKGFSASVQFEAIHNPLLEPDDVIEVSVPEYGLHQLHVIDSISYPLTGGKMTAQTRAVKTLLAGCMAVAA